MTLSTEQRNAARKLIAVARRSGYMVARVQLSKDGKLRIRLALGLPTPAQHQRHRRK